MSETTSDRYDPMPPGTRPPYGPMPGDRVRKPSLRQRWLGRVRRAPKPPMASPSWAAAPREAWGKWAVRIAVLATCGLLMLLGVRDIARSATSPRTAPTPASAAPAVDQGAEAFAVRFVSAYLTYDSAGGTDDYRKAVTPYLANDMSADALWNGQGHESVSLALPVAYRAKGPVVTVAAELDGHRWLYVAVPLIHDGSSYAVAAKPALVPPPARDSRPQQPSYPQEDAALEQQLQSNLSAFFQAYGGGGQTQLNYYTAPGTSLTALQGVSFDSLQDLRVFAGGQERRTALADVRWKDTASGGSLVQTYALTLAQINGKWLVAAIAPAGGA